MNAKEIFREVDVEAKKKQALESSLSLMIAVMMTIKLHEKAWSVLVDQAVMTFVSQISVQMTVTRNSLMIGEQSSRTAVDQSVIEGEFHLTIPTNKNHELACLQDSVLLH